MAKRKVDPDPLTLERWETDALNRIEDGLANTEILVTLRPVEPVARHLALSMSDKNWGVAYTNFTIETSGKHTGFHKCMAEAVKVAKEDDESLALKAMVAFGLTCIPKFKDTDTLMRSLTYLFNFPLPLFLVLSPDTFKALEKLWLSRHREFPRGVKVRRIP